MPRPLATVAAGALVLVTVTACSSSSSTPTATTTTTQSTTTTATQTATATKTATATATQTTTATASASTSSAAASSSGSATSDLALSYCIPNSKVCFRYPKGYRIVEEEQPKSVAQSGQFGHLVDPQGNPLLYFSYTASGALGGAEPNDAPTHRVLRAEKTAGVADRYGDTPLYASAVAVTVPGKGYFLRQFLTSSKQVNQVGTFRTGNLLNGTSSVEYPEFKPDNMLTLTTRNRDASVASFHATPEEVEQQLATPAAQTVFQILQSVTTG